MDPSDELDELMACHQEGLIVKPSSMCVFTYHLIQSIFTIWSCDLFAGWVSLLMGILFVSSKLGRLREWSKHTSLLGPCMGCRGMLAKDSVADWKRPTCYWTSLNNNNNHPQLGFIVAFAPSLEWWKKPKLLVGGMIHGSSEWLTAEFFKKSDNNLNSSEES